MNESNESCKLSITVKEMREILKDAFYTHLLSVSIGSPKNLDLATHLKTLAERFGVSGDRRVESRFQDIVLSQAAASFAYALLSGKSPNEKLSVVLMLPEIRYKELDLPVSWHPENEEK